MVTKKKTIKVVDSVLPILKSILNMDDIPIDVLVLADNDKSIKNHDLTDGDTVALSFCTKSGAGILLFWNKEETYLNVVSTLFHELMHAKFELVRNSVDTSIMKCRDIYEHVLEEKIIQEMESIFTKLIRTGDLGVQLRQCLK